jgi:HAD superfamily hydrolase (TIGR01509 family)
MNNHMPAAENTANTTRLHGEASFATGSGSEPGQEVDHPRIDAVLFDLDGTLIDSEPVYWESDKVFLAQYGIDFTEELNDAMFGWGAVDFFAHLQKLFPQSPLSSMQFAEKLRLKDEAYLEYGKRLIQPFPGVAAFARQLAAQGVPIAIASGSSPLAIERTLGYAGLHSLFSVRVSALEVARGKPAPDIFFEAALRLGVQPTRCLVLEDSLAGVKAAKAAGMACLALPAQPYTGGAAVRDVVVKAIPPTKAITPAEADRATRDFNLADLIVPGGAAAFSPEMVYAVWSFA